MNKQKCVLLKSIMGGIGLGIAVYLVVLFWMWVVEGLFL